MTRLSAGRGFEGEGPQLGLNLFKAILEGHSGVVFAEDDIEEAFDKLRYEDKRLRLNVGEMLDEVDGLGGMQDLVERDEGYDFVLAAGERRSYTANTIIRNPEWQKSNDAISMSVNPEDAIGRRHQGWRTRARRDRSRRGRSPDRL